MPSVEARGGYYFFSVTFNRSLLVKVTCGSELAVMFVDALVKGKIPCDPEIVDRIRKIYKLFPQIPVPSNFAVEDDVQELTEALGAAKTRLQSCYSFLKAAIKWSAEFGADKNGDPQLHTMLAEYIYSESPEMDMAKVSYHFVRGNNLKKFATTLVNFMSKCYPGEDDIAIARAILITRIRPSYLTHIHTWVWQYELPRTLQIHENLGKT
ncbi:hypothetical protein V6Z11_A05G385100 [Gossypium hirsutum]